MLISLFVHFFEFVVFLHFLLYFELVDQPDDSEQHKAAEIHPKDCGKLISTPIYSRKLAILDLTCYSKLVGVISDGHSDASDEHVGPAEGSSNHEYVSIVTSRYILMYKPTTPMRMEHKAMVTYSSTCQLGDVITDEPSFSHL